MTYDAVLGVNNLRVVLVKVAVSFVFSAGDFTRISRVVGIVLS
jgi:hypothetical protein